MNKKGSVGGFIVFFIGVIVALTLLVTTAQNVGTMTDTIAIENQSLGAKVVNGTAQYITNCRALSDVVIYNETADELISDSDYTVTNNVVNNGALAVEIVPDTGATTKSIWQVSGTCQPLTYADDSASRSIAGLIVIMGALAIAGFAFWNLGKEAGWMKG